MRFHILGLGPIGNLVSYHLRRALPRDHSITLIHKTQAQANAALAQGGAIHIEQQGLVTTANGFRSEVFEGINSSTKSSAVLKEVGRPENIESLFITTKAHQTVPAVRRLLPRLSSNTTIVLLQNGMGVYEELVHDIFRNSEQRPHFILASNTHGAFRKNTHFVHAAVGDISFGIVPDPGRRNFEAGFEDPAVPKPERRPRLSDITTVTDDPSCERYNSLRNSVAALLLLEPLNVTWRPMSQIQTAMRRKLVANAVINPLTALMGCRNGDLFTTVAAQRVLQRICQESSDAFAAQIRADSQAWLGTLAAEGVDTEDMSVERLPRALTRPALEAEVLRVAQATKGNISSMLADIRQGRSTEVDFINGYLLKLGSTYRVEMPATATLLNLVKMRSAIPIDQIL
ncbi:ketopantoate reductase-like protein [Lyophyllum atratum]|nr:ketopantoate reductase-like protein [Lyophyllum atratum]